ncbi:hypothetical protein [Imtechella halotolerans]|uniref:DUF2116 family Zn-ribbon domain-containing protein n=1 Tax=Imtechella halotolerans K1 TaxID=946077 RepID=I0WHP4_9FLAO|nr:hypothetical protein [Imtechella halotolerans]EID75910.1 hypothetical protein W5A_03169 [Imtechella halotolerans K1]WMQ63100.1 hypothetical protein PT603_12265 [Imtechella halotolerans]
MDKKCLECGEKIVGRADKKFCNDYCRNAYNNNLHKDSKNLIRNINNKLKKNYKILSELNPEDKTRTTKMRLLDKGFDFEYFTNQYKTKTGNIYHFVYDLGYLMLDNDYFMIVRRER